MKHFFEKNTLLDTDQQLFSYDSVRSCRRGLRDRIYRRRRELSSIWIQVPF